jgi:hypothetical protein
VETAFQLLAYDSRSHSIDFFGGKYEFGARSERSWRQLCKPLSASMPLPEAFIVQ